MGKKRYVWHNDAWASHEEAMRASGGPDTEGADRLPLDVQGAGGRVRTHTPGASLGLDSTDVNHSGDRVVVLADAVDPKSGDHILQYARYDDNGKYRGTYEQKWARTGERRHTSDTPRRIYGF